MRVLVITPWYPTEAAPVAGVFVRDHAIAGSRRHDVRVIHLDFEGRDRSAPLGPPWVRSYRIPLGGPAGLIYSLVVIVAAVLKLLLQWRCRPDVIHGHVYKVAPHSWLLSRLIRRPWVHTEHWSGFEEGLAGGLPLECVRRLYPRAAVILPVSDHLAEVLAGHGVTASYRPVWNAVDTVLFAPPAGDRAAGPVRFLAVGLMDDLDRKNFGRALDAFADLEPPDWRLTLVGDGPARLRHEQRAASLGLEGRVRFTGSLRRDQVAELMQSSDVLVHAAEVETFCIVVGEALCTGMEVLATPTGAIPEMVRETGGGIVTSVDGLPDALRRALDRRQDRVSVAAAARELLSTERLTDRLDSVYRSVAKRGRATERVRRGQGPPPLPWRGEEQE
jgi:L-malate glycosyltransferase